MGSSEPLFALRVAKHNGKVALSKVRDLGLLDHRRKVVVTGEHLEIPMKAARDLGDIGELVKQEVPIWYRIAPSPYELIQRKADVADEFKKLLPRRWERIGDVLLVKLPKALRPHSDEVCGSYAEVLGVKAILDVRGGMEGPWRLPRLELLWGSDTVTVHKENGIRFQLDVRKVMFSSGNVDERIRMSKVCGSGEVVVDLFAGIGYFAIPMAVHGGADSVYACEVNPTAYEYLIENIRINEAEAVEPVFGDCREVAPEGVADRVVLGYLKETQLYLPKAVRCLGSRGWIHFHEACPDNAVSRLSDFLREAASTEGRQVEKEILHRVKSYAPGVSHWVLDALIS